METIEAATIRDQLRPFLLEDVPHRLFGTFGMRMCLGVGYAFIGEPGIQFVVGLEPQPRGKEALALQADLVLHLTFLPA